MRKRCTKGVLSAASFAFKFSTIRLLNYYRGVDRFLVLNEVQADKPLHESGEQSVSLAELCRGFG